MTLLQHAWFFFFVGGAYLCRKQENDDSVLFINFKYLKDGSPGRHVENHIYNHPEGCFIVVDAVGRF